MTIDITSVIPSRLNSDWLIQDGTIANRPQVLPVRKTAAKQPIHVEALHLRKSYGQHLAVKDVSFSIEGGEVLGLLGPNGAGKSTSMMMLAGLLDPTSGEILVNGQKYNGRNLEQRRLFGIVPQEYAIYEGLSALDNLSFFGTLYGLRRKELKTRCNEVLEEIGLTEDAKRPASTYSGGMKRRLNFGIAVMHKPAVLILDEPTLGVDPQSRIHLMNCIHQQTTDGGCVVYASHYMEEAQAICNRVVILDQGEVLKNDSIQHLLAGIAADLYIYVDSTSGITNELKDLARVGTGNNDEPAVIVSGNVYLGKDDIKTRSTTNGLKSSQPDGRDRTVDLGARLQSTLSKLKNLGIQVLSVETQQSNLEQLFLQLTGKRVRE